MPILLKLGLDGRIPLNAERINAMFIGMPDDCINCGKVHEPGECEEFSYSSSSADPVKMVSEKWGCTPEQAEHKITSTMKILELSRDSAIAFLASVHPLAAKPRPG